MEQVGRAFSLGKGEVDVGETLVWEKGRHKFNRLEKIMAKRNLPQKGAFSIILHYNERIR